MKNSKKEVLIQLFFGMLYISAFTFGGGFVIATFMKQKFVDELHWIEESEMLDMIALAQSSPGAIAVNAAILVGWRVAGFWGMLACVLGTILPPIAIITIISFFYQEFSQNRYVTMILKGMQAGVAAVILDVVCGLGANVIKTKQPILILLMFAAFAAAFVFDLNVICIILISAIIGAILELVQKRGVVK